PGGGPGHGRGPAAQRDAAPGRSRCPARRGPGAGRVVLHLDKARRGGAHRPPERHPPADVRGADRRAGPPRGGARRGAGAGAGSGARFEAAASDQIMQVMWEKWVFLASLAGITCLTRAAVRDIVAAGGADLAAALLDECGAIAAAAGYPPRADAREAS